MQFPLPLLHLQRKELQSSRNLADLDGPEVVVAQKHIGLLIKVSEVVCHGRGHNISLP